MQQISLHRPSLAPRASSRDIVHLRLCNLCTLHFTKTAAQPSKAKCLDCSSGYKLNLAKQQPCSSDAITACISMFLGAKILLHLSAAYINAITTSGHVCKGVEGASTRFSSKFAGRRVTCPRARSTLAVASSSREAYACVHAVLGMAESHKQAWHLGVRAGRQAS